MAALLLVLHAAACMGAPRAVNSPRDYIEREEPKQIILTRTDGTIFTVDAPELHGDTLLGYRKTESGRAEVVWLGLPDVEQVAVRKVDPFRTGLVVVAGIAGLVTFFALLSGSGQGDPRVGEMDEDSRVPRIIIRP